MVVLFFSSIPFFSLSFFTSFLSLLQQACLLPVGSLDRMKGAMNLMTGAACQKYIDGVETVRAAT
jgi:hypothetical protein